MAMELTDRQNFTNYCNSNAIFTNYCNSNANYLVSANRNIDCVNTFWQVYICLAKTKY